MRRSTIHTALAILLAVMVVAPVAAVEPGGDATETLSGTLQQLWVESPADGRGHLEYDLRTRTGAVPLEFADGGPEDLAGARVEVTGRRVGRTLHVAGSTPARGLKVRSMPPEDGAWQALGGATTSGGTDSTYSTAAAGTSRSFAVILINFTNNTSQPFTRSAVQGAITGSSSLKSFYEEESKGRLSVSGSVYGWYTIGASTTGCDWRTWHTLGVQKAQAAGVDVNAFSNLIFIWPDVPECGFAGVAYVNGTSSYINGNISVQVITHEVGHNLGLGHANSKECTSGGSRVWLAANDSCTTRGYADPFSTMGNNALRHNHGSQLGELGWLSDSEKVVGGPGNTYTISPYFSGGQVKLVRVPRGDGTFFDLDFRTPYGIFDTFSAGSPAVAGATIRIGKGTASPTGSPQATELLDTTPSTTDLKDAPLLVGRTVKDPVSSLSFTTTGVSASGVTVQVREGVAPSGPAWLSASATDQPRVDLSWPAGSDNVGVAGYRIARDGATLATVGAGTTSWSDGSVGYGTGYTYTVATVDTSGNASGAASAWVQTPANPNPGSSDPAPPAPAGADGQAPSAPDPLTGTPATTRVSLAWGASTDDTGVNAYRVTRNGTLVATVSGGTLAWVDTRRQPTTTYTYGVQAVDAAGNASSPSQIAVTTLPDTMRPTIPGNFRISARSGKYVTFRWSRSTDNVKVARYIIYRWGYTRPVKRVLGTRATIPTVRGARYYVRAQDTSGNKSWRTYVLRGRR
jgi:hypothetical protein